MRKKNLLSKRIICFIFTFLIVLCLPGVAAAAKSKSYTTDDLSQGIDNVITYRQNQAQASSVQDLIDTGLTKSAGNSTADWFVLALSRYGGGYDYSKYLKALEANTTGKNNLKATDLQRIAIVESAVGENEKFAKNTIKTSIGKLGIMSYVYGLILMDCRDYSITDYTRAYMINEIIGLQLKDGGWALSGSISDIDVTAMALQALAPYDENPDVATAVDKAVALLSKRQESTGDYKSWGTNCCESTAQVITALSALDINVQTDKRFIKKKKTLLEGLLRYQQTDGEFSHIVNGKSDNTASVQAMYSLIATLRQMKGSSSFYNFSGTDKMELYKAEVAAGQSKATSSQDTEATSGNGAGKKLTDSRTSTVGIGSTGAVQSGEADEEEGNSTTSDLTGSDKAITGLTETDKLITGSAGSDNETIDGAESAKVTTGLTKSDKASTGQISTDEAALNQISEGTADSGDTLITQKASDNNSAFDASDGSASVTPESSSGASDASSKALRSEHSFHMDYRMLLTILAIPAVLLLFVIFYITGRRSRKNYITAFAVIGIILAGVWGIKFQSVEDYYRANPDEIQEGSATVQLSIRCDTVAGQREDIPSDGILLEKTKLPIKEGDSVLDILILATKQNELGLDYEGGSSASLGTAYVKGIDDLYETDFGAQSGWLYLVNGDFPGTACGDYKVKDGDLIEWVYTCDLGKDVGRK